MKLFSQLTGGSICAGAGIGVFEQLGDDAPRAGGDVLLHDAARDERLCEEVPQLGFHGLYLSGVLRAGLGLGCVVIVVVDSFENLKANGVRIEFGLLGLGEDEDRF